MAHPSEILFWDILPAIRKELVLEMKVLGLKQIKIAKLLDITPSAVSLYLTNKRGEFCFKDSFKKKIKVSAKKVASEKSTSFDEINSLVKEFEKSKALCTICCDKNNIDKDCKVCFK